MSEKRSGRWLRQILLGFVVLLAALWLYGNHRTRRSEDENPPIGKFVTVGSTKLHFVEKGVGPAVVMIHGSDGLLQDFTLTIFDSVASFAHAFAFDRPGHGYSERPDKEPLTLALNAKLIHDGLFHLGVERPVIVGHSYGCAVALQYARDYPNDLAGLVLLSPAVYSDGLPVGNSGARFLMSIPNVPILGPILVHTLVAPLFGFGVQYGIKPSFAPNPVTPAYASIMAAFMPRPGQFRAWADESTHFAEGLDSLAPHYRDIAAPTLIVAGGSDQIAPVDKEAQRLAGDMELAELIVLPDVGHMVHHARPGAVVSALGRAVRAANEHPAE